MPPLLANNHWLMIIMVLFTWHQIGQTIDVSNKSLVAISELDKQTKSGINRLALVDTVNTVNTINTVNKLERTSIESTDKQSTNVDIVNKSISTSDLKSSNKSTLFLSTSSPLRLNSIPLPAINNSSITNPISLVTSSIDSSIDSSRSPIDLSTSSPNHRPNKLNNDKSTSSSKNNYKTHFDSVHAGFGLINSTLLNASSSLTNLNKVN